MLSLRSFWSRHRRKLFVSLGVLGSGYVIYKLYDAHRKRIFDLEKEFESQHEVDELIKMQLQSHFENIQRVSDTVTLPHAMKYLRSRMTEELELSHLTEKLRQGKGQSSALSTKEKLELWERLKVLSFTRTAASLWSMMMLSLYVRVQVNILGRHLYLEIARSSESSQSHIIHSCRTNVPFSPLSKEKHKMYQDVTKGDDIELLKDQSDSFSWQGQQDFLATADYLSSYGIGTLLNNMQNAAMEILKEKQLKEPFNMDQLRETIVKILDLFMSAGELHHWISYLVPENATMYRQLMVMSSNGFDDSSMIMDVRKLEQLMLEARTVLSSPDFKKIVEITLREVVDTLVEDMYMNFGGGIDPSSSSGVPLAKLLPRVTQMCQPLLEEPSSNTYIRIIGNLPEVHLFYTLLYSNMPLEF